MSKDKIFEELYKTAVFAMVIIDKQGYVEQFNPAAEKIFKYKAKDVIGKNIKFLMPDSIAKGHDKYLKQYLKTKKKVIIGKGREVQAIRKDGQILDLFLSVSEISIENELKFAGIMHDITEVKKIQVENNKLFAFSQSMTTSISFVTNYKELLSNILENLIEIFELDIAHFYDFDTHENMLKSSNLFASKDKRKFKKFIDITKKKKFKKGEGLPGMAWKTKKIINYKDVYKIKNFPRAKLSKNLNVRGAIGIPLVFDGNFLGVVECFSQNEISLSQSEITHFEELSKILNAYYGIYQENRNLNLMFNASGEGVYGLDEKGFTTFVNPAACKVLGYEAHELIGKHMHETVHHSYPDGSKYDSKDCYMYAALKDGKTHHINDEVLWRKDGTAVEVEYTSTPIYEEGKIIGAVVTFLDISKEANFRRHIAEIAKFQERYIEGEDTRKLFEYILQYLLKFTNSDYGFIGPVLKDHKGSKYLRTYAITNISWDKKTKEYFEKHSSTGLEFRNLNTLFGHTIKTGEIVISNCPKKDKRSGGIPKGHPQLDSYLGVPIFGASGLIAMFGIANRPGGYSQSVIEELKPIVNMLSSMIESSKNYAIIDDLAKFDSLTSVYNRNYFEKKVLEYIRVHQAEKSKFALLMFDLNDFKKINDTCGHHIGDEVLVLFTKRLSSVLKETDLLARIGGDEFCVLLKNISKIEEINKIVNRVQLACKKPYSIQGRNLRCRPSTGVVIFPTGGDTLELLMRHVDFALYEAKKHYSNWRVYNDQMKASYMEQTALENELGIAFEKEQFSFLYQPQIKLDSGEIYGAEILCRWKSPKKGMISPQIFIPTIERMKLADKLNIYVIKHALAELKTLKPKKSLQISINISPNVENFAVHLDCLTDLVSSTKLHPNISIEFELTESGFIGMAHQFEKDLNRSIRKTRRSGVAFAIDDFGVEYSSINRLIEYQFDTIKIDMVFTQKLITKDKNSSIAIIKAIKGLSKDLNFTIIAEGAETKEQVDILQELGCDIVQGYYFYKPLTKKQFIRILGKEI